MKRLCSRSLKPWFQTNQKETVSNRNLVLVMATEINSVKQEDKGIRERDQ